MSEPFSTNNTDFDKYLKINNFHNLLIQSVMEFSMFGNSIIYKDINEKLSLVDLESWIPVINPFNTNESSAHVIFNLIEDILYVRIHEIDQTTYKTLRIFKGKISEILSEKVYKHNYGTFDLIIFNNLNACDSIFGTSDYTNFVAQVAELMVRETNLATVLDKHGAGATLVGPDLALERDPETDEVIFNIGNYIINNSDTKIEYLTWDARLESTFETIKLLKETIYQLSELGSVGMSDQASINTAESGEALKLKLLPAIYKMTRIRNEYKSKINNFFSHIFKKDLEINFADGLPNNIFPNMTETNPLQIDIKNN
jgi:hypothetical protein